MTMWLPNQVLDILKSVKLSMLQTQKFEPRDVVEVLKSLPEKDLLVQLEVSWYIVVFHIHTIRASYRLQGGTYSNNTLKMKIIVSALPIATFHSFFKLYIANVLCSSLLQLQKCFRVLLSLVWCKQGNSIIFLKFVSSTPFWHILYPTFVFSIHIHVAFHPSSSYSWYNIISIE